MRRKLTLLVATLAIGMLVGPAVALAATVTVTPASATNVVGQLHCVTATVTGVQSPGFTVEFTTTTTSGSAVAVPDSGSVPVVTDPSTGSGQAQFCFTSLTPGDIMITATARGTGTGARPQGTATKTFVPAAPTDKDQCKNGGWQTFGVFANQGDCVSFVATGGRNAASLPLPG